VGKELEILGMLWSKEVKHNDNRAEEEKEEEEDDDE
jgi:hypothetical protein